MRLILSAVGLLYFAYTASIYAKHEIDASELYNKNYVDVREYLLSQGWKVDMTYVSNSPVDLKFPEIACGEGKDAVCSVGYLKSEGDVKKTLALIVKPHTDEWIIEGSY